MGGAKGCNDDCAAFIIYIVNGLLVLGTLASLAFAIYVWVIQGGLVDGAQDALSVYVPEIILIIAIVIFLIILTISLLGIISTCMQMKEHEKQENKKKQHYTPDGDDEKDERKKDKPKGCCWNWGLSFYVFLCILGFLLLLVVGFVSLTYSDKMTQFSALDTVRDQGDEWLSMLEEKLDSQVLELADQFPVTWNRTQAVAGCCGWSIIEAAAAVTDGAAAATAGAATDPATAGAATDPAATGTGTAAAATDSVTTAAATDPATTAAATTTTTVSTAPLLGGRRALADASTVTGFTDSVCCQNANAVTSVDLIGKVQFDFDGCRKDDAGQVYTCQGIVASSIQSNLVRIAIISIILAIAQLTLGVSGCVVRYPHCFPCCNCEKKKVPNSHVEPSN